MSAASKKSQRAAKGHKMSEHLKARDMKGAPAAYTARLARAMPANVKLEPVLVPKSMRTKVEEKPVFRKTPPRKIRTFTALARILHVQR